MAYSRKQGTPPRANFRAGELRAQVLLLQRLGPIPVEIEFQDTFLDRALAAAPPHSAGKAPGLDLVVRPECEPLAFHLSATLTPHATHFVRQVHTHTAAAVSSPDWPYEDECLIRSPCETPGRQYSCAFQPRLHP